MPNINFALLLLGIILFSTVETGRELVLLLPRQLPISVVVELARACTYSSALVELRYPNTIVNRDPDANEER
jgi:hypothetical protein